VSLTKHVESETRRAELLKIESNLKEHEYPPQLVIENTSHCNLRCVHCSHKEMQRSKGHMDRKLWNKIVEEIGRNAPECEVWPTFYGEALILGDELWDRLNYAASVGCKNLVLNSNGTLLHRYDNIEKILKSPLKRFILSLDGFTKETFEEIRVKAKHDQVYENTQKLCQLRLEKKIKHPVIIAQYSVMKENAHEAEEFKKFWQDQGAEVKLRPMVEWTSTGSIRTETIVHDSDFRIACPWAFSSMAIHQNGSVVACAVDYEGKFNVGNMKDKSVKELWAELKTQLRDHHIKHEWEKLPTLCQNCGDWQTAGAEYEAEKVEGTRPHWFYEVEQTQNDIA
jgi:radical SAM protein with 4Fe4S-binding SPASM domain